VILSSCSPVIKDLLIQTNHPHPLVYLRGVKSMQIKALLDFIYRGEVDIAREDLDDFLEVARELKVKGLAEDNKKGEELSANTSKSFGNNEDKFTPAKVKSAVPTPTVYSSIVKEEYVFKNQNQKTYCETHEESNFEPHIKMEEQDYYEDEDFDGEACYEPMSYKCEFCDEIVSRDGDDYKNHLRIVHDVQVKEKKVLGCPDCFELKEDYMALKRCQTKHKNDKSWLPPTKFECNNGDCDNVAYDRKKSFLHHMRRRHRMIFKATSRPDQWVCMYCQKIYASSPSLSYHEKKCRKNPVNAGRKSKEGFLSRNSKPAQKPRSEDVYMESGKESQAVKPSLFPQDSDSPDFTCQNSTMTFDF